MEAWKKDTGARLKKSPNGQTYKNLSNNNKSFSGNALNLILAWKPFLNFRISCCLGEAESPKPLSAGSLFQSSYSFSFTHFTISSEKPGGSLNTLLGKLLRSYQAHVLLSIPRKVTLLLNLLPLNKGSFFLQFPITLTWLFCKSSPAALSKTVWFLLIVSSEHFRFLLVHTHLAQYPLPSSKTIPTS